MMQLIPVGFLIMEDRIITRVGACAKLIVQVSHHNVLRLAIRRTHDNLDAMLLEHADGSPSHATGYYEIASHLA